MPQKSFEEFLDKKKRDAIKELRIVQEVLRAHGLRVEEHVRDDDPYVFCYSPSQEADFDGIRIYKVGDKLAFRVQKESMTHPYGRAYSLDLREMYNDMLSDEDISENEAGKRVMRAVAAEIRRFFERSIEAERDFRKSAYGDPGAGDQPGGQTGVPVNPLGADYSSRLYVKN